MALPHMWETRPTTAAIESGSTSSPLTVLVGDEVSLPVAFHVAGVCLEPDVRLVDGEALVRIPVVVRVWAEAEGGSTPPPVELHLTITAPAPPGELVTAVQRLRVVLPVQITSDVTARVADVRPLDAPPWVPGIVM